MNETQVNENIQRAAVDLVRLALSHEYNRKPLRKEDIKEKVLSTHLNVTFKEVFACTQKNLRDFFGYELVELPSKRKNTKRKGTSNASSGRYTLKNILSLEDRKKYPPIWLKDEESFNGVVAVVLSIVFLTHGTISAETLLMRVEQLQLPYLSIFEGLLQQDARTRAIEMLGYMVKSEYLIKNEIFSDISGSSRAQSSHGTINQSIQADNLGGLFDFSWGPRAFVEYDYFDLAHFIGEVLDTDPDSNFLLRISRVSGKSITEERPGESLDQTQEQQPV